MPQRKVGKRKRLKPLILSGHRGLLRVVVHLESVFVHLHSPVTRASYFRRRCARRIVILNTVWVVPPSHFVLFLLVAPRLISSWLDSRIVRTLFNRLVRIADGSRFCFRLPRACSIGVSD